MNAMKFNGLELPEDVSSVCGIFREAMEFAIICVTDI